MKLPTQQLERALKVCQMIEVANGLINSLQKDLNNYNNPSTEYDKIRLMMDRNWIESELQKYRSIVKRLSAWYSDIIAKIERVEVKQPELNSLYCFAPSTTTALDEAGIVRYIGQSKSGKLLKFEFVNYFNKKGAKYNLFFVDQPTNLQKIA